MASELFLVVQNEKLVKYLITFKNDICDCLEQSKFFEKTIEISIDETATEKKKGREKEKGNKWIPHE